MSESPTPELEPLWRSGAGAGSDDSDGAGATRKLLLLIAATGLALGGLLGVASWLRPHPYPVLLPLFVDSGDAGTAPVTAQIKQDASAMRAGRWLSRAIGSGELTVTAARLGAALESLAGVRSDETLVTVLCAPARIGVRSTDSAGAAEVLITPGGRAEDVSGWVPLRDVLRAFARSRARRVLLLLDVMRPLPDPLGVQLAHDVTDRVEAELATLSQASPGGKLTVLCAAGAGQVSWASDTWGRSVFLAYAEEGLSGWADLEPNTGNRDGRVTLTELVEYVVPRVDRWAVRCRGVRQTPVLLGAWNDFTLAPRRSGALVPRSAPPEDRAYPVWLEEGWSLRDRWQADEALRFAPWALRRLEAALIDAEKWWGRGGDPDRIRTELTTAIGPLTRDFEAAQSSPHPVPRSLAMAFALGEKPDERVSLAMAKLIQERSDPGAGLKPEELAAARAKQVADFQTVASGATEFALARAVFDAAATAVRHTPADLVFLDGLLRVRQPDPLYVETLLLRRLADRAQSGGAGAEWPSEPVRLALEAARRGEPAHSRPRPFAHVSPWLDAAARERHLGEIALFSPGFVSADLAEPRLHRAVELYDAILAGQEILEHSWNLRDEALAVLPWAVELLEANRQLDATWHSAALATIDLDDLLSKVDRRPVPVNEESPVTELLLAVAPVRSRMQVLEQALGALRQATSSLAMKNLIAQVPSKEADAQTGRQLDAALATPLLAAKDRTAVWTAARDLDRRLLEATLSTEPEGTYRENAGPRPAAGELGQRQSLVKEAARRAGVSIALLRLAGQAPERLTALEETREQVAQGAADWPKLGQALQLAWMEPQASASGGTEPARQERMARVVPLELGGLLLGRWSHDPVLARQSREWTALWSWLSDRMLYEARDLHGLPFHAAAARGYNPPGRVLPVPDVRMVSDPSSLTLTSQNRSATLRLELSSIGRTDMIGLRFLSQSPEAATIRPDFSRLEGARQEPAPAGWTYSLRPITQESPRLSLPLLVERSEAGRFLKPSSGFLVQYQVAGWPFTSELAIAMPADTEAFRVILGDTPGEPTDRLLVRPGTGPTPLPLGVRNPTRSPRTIVVELRAGQTGAPVLSPKQTVDAGAVQPVTFGQGPLPQGRLPTLAGPLRFRVLDADHPGVILGEQEVRARVLPVPSYVQVIEIRYTPARTVKGEPNRLTVGLRARPMGGGPPCPVELVLPPGRIPGFLSAESGLFRGELPVDGQEMRLFAEAMRFEEGADGLGSVELNIDGVPRAQTFHIRFNHEGGPTLAERAIETALRIRAPKAVRTGEPLAIVAEVDNADEDSMLELSLGRADHGSFQPLLVRKLDGPRQGRVGFLPTGPGGSPVVEASLQDWSVDFPTAGIQGTYEIRARLRDAQGHWLLSVSKPIIIDDTPPRWVKMARLPKQAKRGAPLEIRATGHIPLSGIREVVFFVGKPMPDGKLPPGVPTASGKPLPGSTQTWAGVLPLPADPKGPIDVSVGFVSNVGLSSFDSGRIELIDTQPVPTGSIRGRVLEAALPQSGLVVGLVNGKNETLETKTDKDGVFSFADVPVGKYHVVSFKPTSKRTGKVEVEVKADSTSMIDVELLYQ